MSRVFVGYGEHNGYRLEELPAETLNDLAARYPLRLDESASPDYEDLLITVAVHAELNRRAAGGKPAHRIPSLRELAEEIVSGGYHQASKRYHPDANGHHEAQVRLTQARDQLRNSCNELADDNYSEGTIVIPAPPTPRPTTTRQPSDSWDHPISDDDVPF